MTAKPPLLAGGTKLTVAPRFPVVFATTDVGADGAVLIGADGAVLIGADGAALLSIGGVITVGVPAVAAEDCAIKIESV